jgi:hypothetical protein
MGLLAVLFCGMTLQQWQLARLRGQLARQGTMLETSQQQVADLTTQLATANAARMLAAGQNELRRQAADSAFWREDERRLMLSGYENFLAQANLPPGRLARLKDLLVERTESVFDAKDAAEQQGIADGTLEMQRAMALATADLDREIAGLLGPASDVRAQELASLAVQNEILAAAVNPAPQDQPLAPPAYAYAPDAGAAAPAYAVLETAPAYYAVSGVFYSPRRESRFNERAQPGRQLFPVPRPAGTRPPVEPPSVRHPARTAPVR